MDPVVGATADVAARAHGYASMEDAFAVASVVGPIVSRQVRLGALGLSLAITAFLFLFEDPGYEAQGGLMTYVGSIGMVGVVLFGLFWLLLGGRNASNPFAMVRPVQLHLRGAGARLLIPGAIAVGTLVVFYLVTGDFISIWALG